jgi:hypothetical protein
MNAKWRTLENVKQGLGSISNAAVDYIKARHEQTRKDRLSEYIRQSLAKKDAEDGAVSTAPAAASPAATTPSAPPPAQGGGWDDMSNAAPPTHAPAPTIAPAVAPGATMSATEPFASGVSEPRPVSLGAQPLTSPIKRRESWTERFNLALAATDGDPGAAMKLVQDHQQLVEGANNAKYRQRTDPLTGDISVEKDAIVPGDSNKFSYTPMYGDDGTYGLYAYDPKNPSMAPFRVGGKPLPSTKTLPTIEDGKSTYSEKNAQTGKWESTGLERPQSSSMYTGGSFTDTTPEEQATWYELYHTRKEVPPFSSRDVEGRRAFVKGYTQYLKSQGLTPTEAAVDKITMDSFSGSLKSQQKMAGLMSSFVTNINKQIDQVKALYKRNDRTSLRLLNIPIVALRKIALGSGDEAVKASYLLEISSEIGKLSTGSSQSVAELSQGARERWDKIHDTNLSLANISTILDATREQANMRIQSVKEEIASTIEEMKKVGKRSPGIQTQKPASKFKILKVE